RVRQHKRQAVGARADDLARHREADLGGCRDRAEMHQEPVDVYPAILLRHRRAVRQERKDLDGDAEVAPQRRQPKIQLNKWLRAPGTDVVRIAAEANRAELLEFSLAPKSIPVLKSRTCTNHLEGT